MYAIANDGEVNLNMYIYRVFNQFNTIFNKTNKHKNS